MAVGGWSKQAVLNNPRLNSIIDAPVGSEAAHFSDYRRLARQIRKGKYGAALVLDRSPLLNMVPYMARVPVRAGLDSENRGLALTHPVPCPPEKARHEVEWYLDVVRALGLSAPREGSYLEFYPTEEEKALAGRALSEANCEEGDYGYVALHLGGGANPGMNLLSKRWQPERWARIADWLAETYETNIILLGGPGKEDLAAADALRSAIFPATRAYIVDLAGKLEWGAMGALIGRCRLFLGHDTGAMHLATAVRTPVVAVFGPTDPVRYGPWDPSRRSVAVAPKHAAGGTGAEALRRASKSNELYHDTVTLEGVWAAIEKIYARGVEKRAVV
jgi:ADP-heptose:LPS heptosyltransferase